MSDGDEENEGPEDEPLEQATVDAASRSGLKRAERRKKSAQREADEFWHAAFSTEVGRRELWKILNEAHPFEQRFAGGPAGFPDPNATWSALGEQLLGLRLYQSWDARYPEGVRLMLLENDPRFKTIKAAPK